jgi:hypothetical protein
MAQGLLGAPPEFIIGPAFGRTRWRGMTLCSGISRWKQGTGAQRLPIRPSFNSATAVAFEICRIARPYDIEIFYRSLLRGHLERWLRTRKLHLRAGVQASDDFGRRCGAGLCYRSQIYHADALKHPHHAVLGHAAFSFVGCFSRDTEGNPRAHLGGHRARFRFARGRAPFQSSGSTRMIAAPWLLPTHSTGRAAVSCTNTRRILVECGSRYSTISPVAGMRRST